MIRHYLELNRVVRILKRPLSFSDLGCRSPEETKKITQSERAQIRYISPMCGGALVEPIATKIGKLVVLDDVINPAKIYFEQLSSFYAGAG